MAKGKKAVTGNGSPTHIGDLHPAEGEFQPREHTPRNIGLIADSLQEVGAARSIVIDEEDRVLAGNGVLEAAGQVGITKLRIIEAGGDEIIAVRRRGLTDPQKRRLALYDNRAGELALYNRDVLAAMASRGETAGIMTEDEVAAILAAAAGRGEPEPPTAFGAPDETTDTQCPKCGYAWSGGK